MQVLKLVDHLYSTLLSQLRDMISLQAIQLHIACPVVNLDTIRKTVAIELNCIALIVINKGTVRMSVSQRNEIVVQMLERHT